MGWKNRGDDRSFAWNRVIGAIALTGVALATAALPTEAAAAKRSIFLAPLDLVDDHRDRFQMATNFYVPFYVIQINFALPRDYLEGSTVLLNVLMESRKETNCWALVELVALSRNRAREATFTVPYLDGEDVVLLQDIHGLRVKDGTNIVRLYGANRGNRVESKKYTLGPGEGFDGQRRGDIVQIRIVRRETEPEDTCKEVWVRGVEIVYRSE